MKPALFFQMLTLILILTLPLMTVHAQGIRTDDLVIYYNFDADSLQGEDILDVSENGNDGLMHGNSLKTVDGKVNECIEFPGVATEYISIRNVNYTEGIPELSIAVWIKTPQRGMIASWDRSDFFRFAAGDAQLGNTTFIAFDICCPIVDWHGDVEVTDDKWHHVAVTFDADKKRIYVDGKLDVEADTHTDNKMIGPKLQRYGFIGVGSESAEFNGAVAPASWTFKGLMDEFFYFHRALSVQEIEHLSKAPSDPFNVEPDGKLSTTWGDIKYYR